MNLQSCSLPSPNRLAHRQPVLGIRTHQGWCSTFRQQGQRICPQSFSTPHSGYHYDGLPRRFFEGWYWKVQIPGTQQSFALIYSIEDPMGNSPEAGVGLQVMGPDDGYICQFSRDTQCFWATRNALELGAVFQAPPTRTAPITGMLPPDEFQRSVDLGFQASTTRQQGNMVAREAGAAGPVMSTVTTASWDLTIRPEAGWGTGSSSGSSAGPAGQASDVIGAGQKATAGWLSVLPFFEPHWQVLMAHGSATGWFKWGGKRYDFKDAPAYAEKNWGGGFPSKWHWIQCNTFEGQPGMSVTAVGARRALVLGVQGLEEDVGLIGIHLTDGTFIELVPWNADLEWDVAPWGRWQIKATNDEYEALVEATCEPQAGTVLRAPTIAQGLAPYCRDTFFGKCRLRLWRRGPGGLQGTPIVDASSTTAALEVGGGPWWSNWSARAQMKEPFRSLVKLPLDVGKLASQVPTLLRPPGL